MLAAGWHETHALAHRPTDRVDTLPCRRNQTNRLSAARSVLMKLLSNTCRKYRIGVYARDDVVSDLVHVDRSRRLDHCPLVWKAEVDPSAVDTLAVVAVGAQNVVEDELYLLAEDVDGVGRRGQT